MEENEQTFLYDMKFEVIMGVKLWIVIFWVVIPLSCRCLSPKIPTGTHYLHLYGKWFIL